jgi:hypothetical protein
MFFVVVAHAGSFKILSTVLYYLILIDYRNLKIDWTMDKKMELFYIFILMIYLLNELMGWFWLQGSGHVFILQKRKKKRCV